MWIFALIAPRVDWSFRLSMWDSWCKLSTDQRVGIVREGHLGTAHALPVGWYWTSRSGPGAAPDLLPTGDGWWKYC